MDITEVIVKLMGTRKDKLRAFCSITLDNAFVVRDLKVIEGAKGTFVAMPSRKLMERCIKCGTKNCIRSNFCNGCGAKLTPGSGIADKNGRLKLHADIAHPINGQCRELIQDKVLAAYNTETERSKQPGYKPPEGVMAVEGDDEE